MRELKNKLKKMKKVEREKKLKSHLVLSLLPKVK